MWRPADGIRSLRRHGPEATIGDMYGRCGDDGSEGALPGAVAATGDRRTYVAADSSGAPFQMVQRLRTGSDRGRMHLGAGGARLHHAHAPQSGGVDHAGCAAAAALLPAHGTGRRLHEGARSHLPLWSARASHHRHDLAHGRHAARGLRAEPGRPAQA